MELIMEQELFDYKQNILESLILEINNFDSISLNEAYDSKKKNIFKRIFEKIIKALKIIKEKIEDLLKKIKELFKSKKLKKAEEDIKNLKKNQREMQELLDNTNKENKELQKSLDNTNKENKKISTELDQKIKDVEFARSQQSEISAISTKLSIDLSSEKEINKKNATKLNKVINSIIDNKYIYFNFWDYIDENNLIQCQYYIENTINKLFTDRTYDDFSKDDYRKSDLKVKDRYEEVNKDKKYILKKEISDRIKINMNSSLKFQLSDTISDNLEEIKNKNNDNLNNNIKKLLELLKYNLDDNTGRCYDFIHSSLRVVEKLTKYLGAITNGQDVYNMKKQFKYDPDSVSDPELVSITSYWQNIIFTIQCNIQFMDILCEFEGKKVGASISAIETLNLIIDN
jgi:hypothetical protein